MTDMTRIPDREIVLLRHDGQELVIEEGSVVSFNMPRDFASITRQENGALTRVLGAAHLNLTFFDGMAPKWRKVDS